MALTTRRCWCLPAALATSQNPFQPTRILNSRRNRHGRRRRHGGQSCGHHGGEHFFLLVTGTEPDGRGRYCERRAIIIPEITFQAAFVRETTVGATAVQSTVVRVRGTAANVIGIREQRTRHANQRERDRRFWREQDTAVQPVDHPVPLHRTEGGRPSDAGTDLGIVDGPGAKRERGAVPM